MDSLPQGLKNLHSSICLWRPHSWQNSIRLQNQGVPKPDGLTVLYATLWPHPKLLAWNLLCITGVWRGASRPNGVTSVIDSQRIPSVRISFLQSHLFPPAFSSAPSGKQDRKTKKREGKICNGRSVRPGRHLETLTWCMHDTAQKCTLSLQSSHVTPECEAAFGTAWNHLTWQNGWFGAGC